MFLYSSQSSSLFSGISSLSGIEQTNEESIRPQKAAYLSGHEHHHILDKHDDDDDDDDDDDNQLTY
ncbi:hypothetical protein BLOT_005320 [Blomia tropicalis]|nr:hypothetical protein BLOT_005320 [Blomia tropicalis]